MPTLLKPLLLGLGLVAGMAIAAQAQTVSSAPTPNTSIANLPPEGPRPSSLENIPNNGPHMPVTASGNYPGPAPGASNGQMPPHYEKPADWDSNVAMHPYTSHMGPNPN
ncbi:MAG TPA: hypothetical protein VHY35_01865 [Stellaceae bacterium]|jgi:hypothetical protein|nr:hypothetical protein [Stellaceae bacterium]